MEDRKLFVGQLDYSIKEAGLSELFKEAGTVEEAIIIYDRQTGTSKGFGFVTMSTPEEAAKAIELLNGKEFNGRKLVVNKAKPRTV